MLKKLIFDFGLFLFCHGLKLINIVNTNHKHLLVITEIKLKSLDKEILLNCSLLHLSTMC